MREEMNSIVKELILKVREGDQAAFSDLLELYSPLMFSCVSRFMSDNSEAKNNYIDDFKQELRIVLYNSVMAYDIEQDEVSFGLYAKICMNNATVTQIRKFNKKMENDGNIVEYNESCDDRTDEKTPETEHIEREKLYEINKKIEKVLSDFENKIWKMYVAGYTTKEMAKVVDRSEKSVENAIFRIRNKLKPIFVNR